MKRTSRLAVALLRTVLTRDQACAVVGDLTEVLAWRRHSRTWPRSWLLAQARHS